MIAILTGDIVNSRNVETKLWIAELKKVFIQYGESSKHWEIFRGDSFQIETSPEEAILLALRIKSAIKQFKLLDVRIAIGIGNKTFKSNKITESNGSAFVHSGESFERLKKQTLIIQTDWKDFDETINLMFDLITLTIDNWTTNAALIMNAFFTSEKNVNQKVIADKLDKKESNISTVLSRSGYHEIEKLIHFYQKEIKERC